MHVRMPVGLHPHRTQQVSYSPLQHPVEGLLLLACLWGHLASYLMVYQLGLEAALKEELSVKTFSGQKWKIKGQARSESECM